MEPQHANPASHPSGPAARLHCRPFLWRRCIGTLPGRQVLAPSLVASLIGFVVITAGCEHPPSSVSLPTAPSSTSAVSPAAPAGWTAGTFTWTSIEAPSRTMCPELTSQVGHSWPLYLHLEQSGDSLTLLINEDGPPDPNDPMNYAPDTWVGTRTGNTISASLQQPNGGMACPADVTVTPETGGELKAAVSGDEISGDFTAVYGTGANAVTFLFHFQAGSPTSSSTSG